MVFLVLLVPLLVMVFALLMERLEHRLQTTTMSEQDVEEFLDQAQPDEVNTFIREGWTRALSMFRLRRRDRPVVKSRLFSRAGSAVRRTAPSPPDRSARTDSAAGGGRSVQRPPTRDSGHPGI